MLIPQTQALGIALVLCATLINGTWPNVFKILSKHKTDLIWFDANLAALVYAIVFALIFGDVGADLPLYISKNIALNTTSASLNPPSKFNLVNNLNSPPYDKVLIAIAAGICLGIGSSPLFPAQLRFCFSAAWFRKA